MLFRFILSTFLLTTVMTFSVYAHNVVDACGRNITLPSEVKRIVAIGPGAVPLTVYADVSKLLVARETAAKGKTSGFCSCALPENYHAMPSVYDNMPNTMPDYKAIVGVKPDVIIASGFTMKQTDEIFQNTKIPVAAVNCNDAGYMHYDTIIQSLRLTGYILKKEKPMQEIMNYLAKIRKDLYERSKDIDKKKIFVLSATNEKESALTSEKCYCYLNLINLSNIPKKEAENRFYNINRQELLKYQPDYIFIEHNLLGRLKKDYLKNKQFYKQLNAVNGGRVYTVMPYNRFSANLENMLMNSYFIGKTVHPSGFSDVDMQTISDEITGELSGNDIYLDLVGNTAVFKNVLFDDKGLILKK